MKKVIGYEVNGKKYWMATHLGESFISTEVVNVYFNTTQMDKDLQKMKEQAISSLPITSEWRGKLYKNFRDGRFFITDLESPKCEIQLVDNLLLVHPTDHSHTVALRKEFTFKLTETKE